MKGRLAWNFVTLAASLVILAGIVSCGANPDPCLDPPVISSLSPGSIKAGGAQFTLTVNGSLFIETSTVLWNGSKRPTIFVNSGQLSATVQASDIAFPGTAEVKVNSPPTVVPSSVSPCAGFDSNSVPIDITP